MGQRQGMSAWDIDKVNKMYRCPPSGHRVRNTAAPPAASADRSADWGAHMLISTLLLCQIIFLP
jgi:hypothetical protein